MGTGIGIVAARKAELDVCFVDAQQASLDKSQSFVANWCQKEISKERMSKEDMDSIMSRITYSTKLESMNQIDFAIEAVNEDFRLKQIIFEGLAQETPSHAILATNTSSISISKIGGIIPDRAH